MNWLNFFETKTIQPQHQFGRGINASIAPDEEDLFEKSQEAFEDKNILDAYEYFFNSLENYSAESSNENIFLKRTKEKLYFEIFQGTAKITGNITQDKLYAQTIITKLSSANIAVKRHLLERNYQLTYAYYSSDNEYIKLKLSYDNITMTPQKIFFPLREIALNADFDKEYLKNEFKTIALEDIEHISQVDEQELRVKYDFLMSSLKELNTRLLTLPTNDNAGMHAFSLLNTLFMIDYLIVPNYDIYQNISKKIQEYFNNENANVEFRNEELKEYIKELQEISFENFCSNFYKAKYTFNPTEKTAKEDVDNFISESLLKVRWYKNNRYKQIIPTIYKYISFYILYNYGIHPILRELLHTLVQIQNQEFFAELGYKTLYNEENDTFSKKAIISRINEIIEPYQTRFKLLEPFGDELNFDSLNEFSNSFYLQIQNLNFEEI